MWVGRDMQPLLQRRAGAYHIADAKWTEHPSPRDAAVLRRVALELPAGSVRSLSIFCRAPNPHSIGAGDVSAVPLGVPAGLGDWI